MNPKCCPKNRPGRLDKKLPDTRGPQRDTERDGHTSDLRTALRQLRFFALEVEVNYLANYIAEFNNNFVAKTTLSSADKSTLRRIMKKVRAIKIAKMSRHKRSK